jgi:1-acyl-sn-glycerol-3-phosphate acyltransferase
MTSTQLASLPARAVSVRPVDADFRPSIYLGFGTLMQRFCRVWFRYEMRGMDRIPEGPCLFVGNHSGVGPTDVLCMLGAWRARFGLRRRFVGMMHDLFVAMPVVGFVAKSFGAVRAEPGAARAAFARGFDVACFPGGDLDSCRPFTAPREVRFGPRRGYVRTALEAGVPIVPIATIGSGYSYLVLPGSGVVAAVIRALTGARYKAFPITVAGLALVATIACALGGVVSPWWLLVAALAAVVPNPVRVTSEVLAPIDVAAETAHIVDPTVRVEAAHALVHGRLAEAVRTMRHE